MAALLLLLLLPLLLLLLLLLLLDLLLFSFVSLAVLLLPLPLPLPPALRRGRLPRLFRAGLQVVAAEADVTAAGRSSSSSESLRVRDACVWRAEAPERRPERRPEEAEEAEQAEPELSRRALPPSSRMSRITPPETRRLLRRLRVGRRVV